jgi:hypothetical protein
VSKVLSKGSKRTARVSLGRLLERARAYLDVLELSLAPLIFDYLALACLGEARHSSQQVGVTMENFDYDSSTGRDHVVRSCAAEYDPSEFLPKLIVLFDEGNWASSYGGSRWAEIARTALRWWTGEWSDRLLIDHCVDLMHNGGLCFDKGFLLYSSANTTELCNLLDDKASRRPLHKWRGSQHLGGCVMSLIRAVAGHGLLKNTIKEAYCPLCDKVHAKSFDQCIFYHSTQDKQKTLSDTGYVALPWPGKNGVIANKTLGELVVNDMNLCCGGCDSNDNEPCDGECSHCEYASSGCEYNGYEPCNGECSECDLVTHGCANNGWENCDGACDGCQYSHDGCDGNGNEPCDGDCDHCDYHEDEDEDEDEDDSDDDNDDDNDTTDGAGYSDEANAANHVICVPEDIPVEQPKQTSFMSDLDADASDKFIFYIMS